MSSEKSSEEIFEDIKNNEIKGASAIARTTAKAIKFRANETSADSLEGFQNEISSFGHKIIENKPSMSSIFNTVNSILSSMKGVKNIDSVEKLRKTVVEKADELMEESETALEKEAEYGSNLIDSGDTILMHSYSSSVLKILKKAKENDKKINVITTESRPLYEGHATVSELLEASIPTTLIIDAAIGRFIEDADKILVGADSVLVDGTVVNKIGTRPLAVLARENNTPVYVATETFKFDPKSLEGNQARIEKHPPQEILGDKTFEEDDLLDVENPFFEETPPKYVNLLITERGVFPPSLISSFSEM